MSTRLRSSRPLIIGTLVLVVLALAAVGYWYFDMRGIVSTDDARVAGDLIDVAPEIGGRLTAVKVDVGDHVKAGDTLFHLDERQLKASVAQAEAALNLAKAQLAAAQAQSQKAQRGPRAQQIQVAAANAARLEAQAKLAEISLKRVKQLRASGSASQQMVDKAAAQVEIANQAHEAAGHQLTLLRQGTRAEDRAAAAAAVQSAEAHVQVSQDALDKAKIALSDAVVHAPFAGVVVRRWRDPGDMANPGGPVITLFDPKTLRVDANVEETNLSQVKVGDRVDIAVDAYPGLHLKGRVATVVKATQSQFSAIPSQGVSGTFIKVTQRVPVRIHVEGQLPTADALLPGLSVEIRIHAGHDHAVAER